MKGKAFVIILSFLLLWPAGGLAGAPKRPATVAELALYEGADRQQILEEGAKKEGKLNFYTTHIAHRALVEAFQKRYPFIKVAAWRADTSVIASRIIEEYKSGQHLFDSVESTQMLSLTLQKAGVLQPYHSPHLAYIEEGAIARAPGGGAFTVVFREGYIGLGYNTKLIAKEQVPKNYAGLLDPKWKGKLPIAGSSTGTDWMGTILVAQGEEFVRRLANQDFQVHAVSARAILDMLINGEYHVSPTIYESHVIDSKKKGAPVEWIPLEPVHVNAGQIALSKNAQNPHAALLFNDYELSKESAEIYREEGFMSPRRDVPSKKDYKKFYGVRSIEEGREWAAMFKKLFVKQ